VPSEIVLFWVVAVGFLLADNLVLLPVGADVLRFGRRGRLVYEPGSRLEARGQELIMLNPINLFDRAAVTNRALGKVDGRSFGAARRQIRRSLLLLNVFSWLGYAYLLTAVALASLSFEAHFGSVLVSFLLTHIVFALIASVVLVLRRHDLALSPYQTFVHVVEALLVPAYTINLGKRLWHKQVLNLPAMTLGIRQAKRAKNEAERELLMHQLQERLALMEMNLADEAPKAEMQGEAVPPSRQNGQDQPSTPKELITEARACLKG
jgi:hypothetical protein